MFDYSQPDFYRFSGDSIVLAKKGHELFIDEVNEKQEVTLVDAFCGCGVVGIEFLLLLSNKEKVKEIYFVEKNEKMIPFCRKNFSSFLEKVNGEVKSYILNEDFLRFGDKKIQKKSVSFFLINPPYFLFNEKKSSNNLDRKKARFFEQDVSLKEIFLKIDQLAQKSKVLGIVLYRKDQYEKKFLYNTNQVLKNISIYKKECSSLNDLTGLFYFKSHS